MEKVILVKYGELTLKGGNRKLFEKKLYNNICYSLKAFQNLEIIKKFDRLYIHLNDHDFEEVSEEMQLIPGIHSFSLTYKTKQDIEEICLIADEIIKKMNITSFRVNTKRSDKNFSLNSMEISSLIGSYLFKNNNLEIKMRNSDFILEVEFKNGSAYVFEKTYVGLGGFPIGTTGEALLMLSGGIDSPVAGYLGLKKGLSLTCLHFESPPHTSIQAKQKVIDLVEVLRKHDSRIKLISINFTKIQEFIKEHVPSTYQMTLARRMMFKITDMIALELNIKAVLTGENLGQVASQTLSSMYVMNESMSRPVLQPLLSFDKQEIITIAKKIKTYDISVRPFDDNCVVFLPPKSETKPSLKYVKLLEYKFSFDDLLKDAVESREFVSINEINLF